VTDRSVLDRLRSGPIATARAPVAMRCGSPECPWAVFIALGFAEQYANELNGVCLIATLPGHQIVSREISLAGGLASWSPGEVGAEDEDRRIWRFIKSRRGCSRPVPRVWA